MDSEGIQSDRMQRTVAAEPVAASNAAAAVSISELNSPLNEDLVLALLNRRELAPETLERISQDAAGLKSRKVSLALAAHPRVPRHLALRLIRQFHTFDLMRFALLPSVAADLKRAADDRLVARLASVTLGERMTLARRGSQSVSAELLLDKECRVAQTALENAGLTEAAVIKAIMRPNARPALVETICHHPKWSIRREIRIALLRSPHTRLARALEFARNLPPPMLRDILHSSRLPEKIKVYLRDELKKRKN
ncbi:MAG: hypothetical protein WB919_09570 [Candidatus Sulfotelmatobacter sp.]